MSVSFIDSTVFRVFVRIKSDDISKVYVKGPADITTKQRFFSGQLVLQISVY